MRTAWLWGCGLALALVSSPAPLAAQSDDKPKAQPVRRLVQSIELAAHKKYTFAGRVTLRVAPPNEGAPLEYYWGGKCKGSKMTASKLELLYLAMREGYAVEIPSEPIEHDDRIHMCVKAIRVIKP